MSQAELDVDSLNDRENGVTRRSLFGSAIGGAAALGLGSLVAGCGGGSSSGGGSGSTSPGSHPNQSDYLNYILNLEYLENEFYTRAVTGVGLSSSVIGSSPGTVTGGSKVPFVTPLYQQVAQEFATEELNQLVYLREQLFSGAVSRPTINFTQGFQMLGQAAGIGSSFNPFGDEKSFLLGAFFFEDLIATAYLGVQTWSASFPSLMGAEAYRGGIIRTLIYSAGGTLLQNANSISSYRSNYGEYGDQTITSGQTVTLVPSGTQGMTPGRAPQQVLSILYQSKDDVPGCFFPTKIGGYIG